MIDEKWDEFVTKFPSLFSEILKHCVIQIDAILKKNYAIPNPVETPTEDQPKIILSQDFESLYSECLFADVELIVKGKVLKAHKAILSSKPCNSKISSYFLKI